MKKLLGVLVTGIGVVLLLVGLVLLAIHGVTRVANGARTAANAAQVPSNSLNPLSLEANGRWELSVENPSQPLPDLIDPNNKVVPLTKVDSRHAHTHEYDGARYVEVATFKSTSEGYSLKGHPGFGDLLFTPVETKLPLWRSVGVPLFLIIVGIILMIVGAVITVASLAASGRQVERRREREERRQNEANGMTASGGSRREVKSKKDSQPSGAGAGS